MTNREMDRMLSSPELPPLPTDRLKQIEAALIADLKPVRPLAPDGAYFLGVASIFLAVCIIGCYLVGRFGWAALSDLQRTAVFVPLALATALLTFSLVRQMRPAAPRVRSSAFASAVIFLLLLAIMPVIFQPIEEQSFVRHGLACFGTGMAFAVPAALLLALLLRRGAVLSPVLAGATAGGLAGLAGLTALEIHCPNLNVYHIVIWHVSVAVCCVILGVIFSSVTFRCWTSNH